MLKINNTFILDTQLAHLGFSEKEAMVYLTLNMYGPSPASTLAKRAGIKRGSIYDILNILLQKNFITRFENNGVTYFGIDDVQKLIHHKKEQLHIAEQVVESLKNSQYNNESIQVQYYNGKEGYTAMYEHILTETPSQIKVWIHLDAFHNSLDPIQEELWTRKRVKKNIYAKLLMVDTPYAREFQKKDSEYFRETRCISNSIFQSTCILYGDCITLFDSQEAFTGIRIQHQNFSQLFQEIFDQHWEKI